MGPKKTVLVSVEGTEAQIMSVFDFCKMRRIQAFQKSLPGEINPNHPVTDILQDNWHKLLAVVLNMACGGKIVILEEDIRAIPSNKVLLARAVGDRISLELINESDSEKVVEEG